MKKRISVFLAVMLCMSFFAMTVYAEENNAEYVYVTIAGDSGKLVLAAKEIQYTADMTADDALRAAHKEYHKDKESAYATELTEYGISLTKLWGISNGGAYGYMINDQSPRSLADPIKAGDHIYAYIYTDTQGFSDTYSFFDTFYTAPDENGTLTLTLKTSGFDENFMPKTEPLAGAVITINGEKTSMMTNAEGQVTISEAKAGLYTISAEKEGMTLVPPVCRFATTGYTYMTMYDETGMPVVTYEPIFVNDLDEDGIITVNDALLQAHKQYKPDGYATSRDAYGDLIIASLWGISDREYGCYIDGTMVYRLTERLSSENHIQAFIVRENVSYSYFSKTELTFPEGNETITLNADIILESGHTLSSPIAGADILINGEKSGIKTDENGKFTLSVKNLKPGQVNILSASSEKTPLIAPVLPISAQTIENAGEAPGLPSAVWMILIVIGGAVLVFGIRILVYKKKAKSK